MIVELQNRIKINILKSKVCIGKNDNVIFFHGFTGSSIDFKYFINNLPIGFNGYGIDLLGHGKSSSPKNLEKYFPINQIKIIDELFDNLEIKNPILIGYSMGGRMALTYTYKFPQKVKALLLESTAFGYATKTEKLKRIEDDIILADKIKTSSLEEFFEYWINIPLFSDLKKLPEEFFNNLKQKKINTNKKLGLINSLIGFSTGRMENYFSKNQKFKMPILLVTGSNDKKFTDIAERANKLFANSEHVILNECGHNVHLQKPKEFLNLITSFLSKLKEKQ